MPGGKAKYLRLLKLKRPLAFLSAIYHWQKKSLPKRDSATLRRHCRNEADINCKKSRTVGWLLSEENNLKSPGFESPTHFLRFFLSLWCSSSPSMRLFSFECSTSDVSLLPKKKTLAFRSSLEVTLPGHDEKIPRGPQINSPTSNLR